MRKIKLKCSKSANRISGRGAGLQLHRTGPLTAVDKQRKHWIITEIMGPAMNYMNNSALRQRLEGMLSAKLMMIGMAMALLLSASGCALIQQVEVTPPERAYRIKLEALKRLDKFKGKINKDLRVTVGSFSDRTGQVRDQDRQSYSKVLTQAGDLVLYHILYEALGPRIVVEREVPNWKQITTEYRSSYTKNGVRTGLITKSGPEGGLVGAQYMVTGAIVFYHVDRYSGGGGLNIDGIGGSFKSTTATVGIELRLVDVSTSEIYWSTLLESWVTGVRIGADVFKFFDAFGGEYLVQAEAGFAYQLPADMAFQTCLATAVAEMIERNKAIFLTPAGGTMQPDS